MACLVFILLTLLTDWGQNSLIIDEFSFGLVKLDNGGAMVKFRGVRVNRDSRYNFRIHIVSISGTTSLLSQTQKD